MADYHEPIEELADKERDSTRALTSLKEEIEAISWYEQRIAASKDESLRKVLAHNREEEIEHASMLLEWLRRNVDDWHEHLATYLFQEGEITDLEEQAESETETGNSLGIGKLS